jgi:hypothetical protein
MRDRLGRTTTEFGQEMIGDVGGNADRRSLCVALQDVVFYLVAKPTTKQISHEIN